MNSYPSPRHVIATLAASPCFFNYVYYISRFERLVPRFVFHSTARGSEWTGRDEFNSNDYRESAMTADYGE